jgi:hypothetical protein
LKKRLENTPRKSNVFFLDRNLGSEKLAAFLRPAGFLLITHHDRYGPTAQAIDDPTIIADCGIQKNILLTADGNLEYTFVPEITKAKIAILSLNNNSEGPSRWGPRIVAALPEIDRELGRRRKPFLMRLCADGTIPQIRLYRVKGTDVIKIFTTTERRQQLGKLLHPVRRFRAKR